MICPLSPCHFVALGAFQFCALLLFVDAGLAPLPLAAFVLLCLVAPFLTRFSFYLPITSRGRRGERGVALTFDDGPDPEVTPKVLEILARHGASATFFVVGRKAERHPELVEAILAGGHTVGNHSHSHDPFLMLKGVATLRREVCATQEALNRFGVVPLVFRPPVGITNSRLWRVLLENGMFCVNFSRRGPDFGNRRVSGLAARILRRARARDIVLLHDTAPQGRAAGDLCRELERILEGLRSKGLEIVPLARLIGKEVMQKNAGGEHNAAQLFYDNLAESYDHEQFSSPVSMSRTTEHRLFKERSPSLFDGSGRVLEVGAGTGIFTLDIARNCREVVAADISGNMLALLEKKAGEAGIGNIVPVRGNVETMQLEGTFTAVCAFSSLEYLDDLPGFFKRLAHKVEPGGSLYFITARSSFFRFFTQIGNAMRQGIWLKAHSAREIERMLVAAGFEEIGIESHLLKCVISGGMLLEVSAKKAGAGSALPAAAARA